MTNKKTDFKCPEKVTLYWLTKKAEEDGRFIEEALGVIRRMNEQKPKILRGTISPGSSAMNLLNEWLVNRDLPSYSRGRAINDYLAETSKPVALDDPWIIDIWDSGIEIYRDDLIRLLSREGMTVPDFLVARGPAANDPEAEEVKQAPVSKVDDAEHANRMVEWRRSIVTHWPGIVEKHGACPTARQIIKYVKENDFDGFIQPGGAPDKLLWKPAGGETKTVKSKTVSNAIAELKNLKLLTEKPQDKK